MSMMAMIRNAYSKPAVPSKNAFDIPTENIPIKLGIPLP